MRLCEPWPVAVAAMAQIGRAADTMQLTWTTDLDSSQDYPDGGIFGPDGPWQALSVFAGESSDDYRYGTPVPLWPSSFDTVEIPTVQAGGNYSVEDSDSAGDREIESGAKIAYPESYSLTADGELYFDSITLPQGIGGAPEETNASINALHEHQREFSGGETLNETVGVLGLGLNSERFQPEDTDPVEWPSILEQLKEDGKIGSASFSLHMGSVALEQSGSMVLGGYDESRIVGKPGVFALPGNPGYAGMPYMPLHDVILGVETGSSPFDSDDPISVYAGLGDDMEGQQGSDLTGQIGGSPGSAVMIPNPAVPYIYLPPGTCEEAAEHLPVTFDPDLDLYLWDKDDAEFSRVVDSPAYLGFVFVDQDGVNVTVKVPFKLLDLSLTPPLVDEPTAYFPCKTDKSKLGWWQLGRAFLQGAFWAVDYDANVTYLAQAPGPSMGRSVMKAMEDGNIPEGSGSELEASWADTWTVRDEAGQANLSAGPIAGIVVGCVAFVGGITTVVILLRRRKKKMVKAEDEKPAKPNPWVSRWKGAETQGTPVQELAASNEPHEAPGNGMAHEMSGEAPPAELPATPPR